METRIVVGVDGSAESADALRWAVEQGRLTGGTVRVLYAWDPGAAVSLGVPPLFDWEPLRDAAASLPDRFVHDVIGADSGVQIETSMVRGGAGQALVEASEHASLIVVGSRGLSGLKGILLGSVGQHCVSHAHCPVVIVHSTPVKPKHVVKRETLHAHGKHA